MTELLVGIGAFTTFEEDLTGGPPDLVIRLGFAEQRLAAGDDAIAWRMLSRHPRDLQSLIGELYRTDDAGQRVAVDPDEIAEAIGRLRDRGLVIGVDPASASLADLSLRVTAVPLYRAVIEGLQTSRGWPIGTATHTVIRLDDAQHALWMELDDARSVAHLAVARAVAAGADPTSPDHASAWGECIDLLRAGAAYFDAAVS